MLNEMFQDEPDKLQVEQVWMTPERAAKLLELNTHNRDIKEKKVNQYVADMVGKRWKLTGDAIKVTKSNFIADGAHRLMACVKAGERFQTLIVFGVEDEAQDAMDTGAVRTLGDVLKLRGEPHCRTLASVARLSWRWERENLQAHVYPSTLQALEWIRDNPDIREYLSGYWYSTIRKHLGVPAPVLVSFFYKVNRVLPKEAKFFRDQLVELDELSKSHPIAVYRSRLENIDDNDEAVSEVDHMAYIIKAWNAFLKGDRPSQIRWRRGGTSPEAFPELLLKLPE